MPNKGKPSELENAQKEISNFGKWSNKYKDISEIGIYADSTSYRLAADFLADIDTVEDWGCGSGGFRLFCKSSYIGVDGSENPFVDKVVDLATYTSDAEGILLRHVLEHNPGWEQILVNALKSFRKKLCIAVFTPFLDKTQVIAYYEAMDVVDIAFKRSDLTRHFDQFKWRSDENLKTESQYGIEHIFYIER
jgi:hypothetical protein